MLTIPEAARRTGRNAETIRRWVRAGRLRAEKVGTQYLVDESDLDAVADAGALDLPEHWQTTADGDPMPQWERIVRDARASH